ncbi:hypothetical protein [Hoeflea sp.]|uniref:hypothetical protein n=1 Tax=Hoeflea sp. TaxID=1940281 RepID=UPI003A91FAE6
MTSHFAPTEFRLPAGAHPRIEAFHALWQDKGQGDLPRSSLFDVATLDAQYPLLTRIGMDESGKSLMWLDVANAAQWPFKTPVKNRPVIESVPQTSIKRVIGAFKQTLASGIPDYYETTSWTDIGRTVSLARIAVPVKGEALTELMVYWEVIEAHEAS